MRLALATAAVLAAGAPAAAAAETVGRGDISAGPVLAGDTVVWADTVFETGMPRIRTARPGGRSVVRHRFPRRTSRGGVTTSRHVAALAASGGRVAALVDTCSSGRRAGPWCTFRAFAGRVGERLAPLARPLPRRAPTECRLHWEATSIATGGGWLATAQTRTCRGGIPDAVGGAAATTRARIVVRRGSRRRVIATTGAHDLTIAGRYLAWIESAPANRNRIVLYDLERGERVRRIASGQPGDLRGDLIQTVDVQADGTLAYVHGDLDLPRAEFHPLGGPRQEIAWGADPEAIAVAGGRVLYRVGYAVLLWEPGAPQRVLQRQSARAEKRGGLDLTRRAATWAVQSFEPGMERREQGLPKILVQRLG